jgi:hypothetical protein
MTGHVGGIWLLTKQQHVVYAYASLAANGTLSLTTAQQQQVQGIVALKANNPALKVFIGGLCFRVPYICT